MQLIPVEQPLDIGITIRGWRTQGRGRPLVYFLHGNGFCGPVYLPMLSELHKDFDLLMLDVPGHGDSDPLVLGWNQTAKLMHEALRLQLGPSARTIYGVGHSLGGVLTLLSAHQHPDTFQSVVLLDPVLFPRRMLLLMRAAKLLKLTRFFHPLVVPTLKRRSHWESKEEARDYLAKRRIYSGWTEEALQAFVDYALRGTDDGTEDITEGGTKSSGVVLNCDPKTEAHYFEALPTGLWRSLREVSCRATCIMGEDSYPFALKAAAVAASTSDTLSTMIVPGGHCYMQQYPLDAARSVKAAIEQAE